MGSIQGVHGIVYREYMGSIQGVPGVVYGEYMGCALCQVALLLQTGEL